MNIIHNTIVKLGLLGTLVFFIACAAAEIKPVDIHPEDVCYHCKMAISEKQFASEFVTPDGEARKFDDLGCMLEFVKSKNPQNVTFFVNDFNTKQWLKADRAFFVKSSEIDTPMSGGIIAFGDQAQAKAAAARFKGSELRFSELLKK
ncbi:MAG TPA: nitrous oxide reductase accessory protein NosL [Blastocatellia bacterium]|nr:nitrous oxide reductase accessory protein NosL [Blastocatellia bacterium]